MEPWKIDVPVLLIFFARPAQFAAVFKQVRLARPSVLLLYQDGPREGSPSDRQGIEACRRIAAHIDWDCKVHRWYREKNVGCDPSEYVAQRWAFRRVDKCIVLEDDDVPSQSFFPFCKEMLERYEFDERIHIICGMNTLGEYRQNHADYFFSTVCSIWGWASWRRVVAAWDPEYSFLGDGYAVSSLQNRSCGQNHIRTVLRASLRHKRLHRAYYESILASDMFLNSRLNIVPSVNLITNIGIAPDSTHAAASLQKLPRGIRRVFFMRAGELRFPLRHPRYMIEDVGYQKKVFRILGWGHPLVGLYRRAESLIAALLRGDFSAVAHKFRKRLRL